MSARDVFRTHLQDAPDPLDDRNWARRVAAAAAAALDAAGVAISVQVRHVRVPLGASDSDAARAESIEFTIGNGPCMVAMETAMRVDAPTATLSARWPQLAQRWHDETPFCSAFSEPLLIDGVAGALNVYMAHEEGRGQLTDSFASEVGALVTAHLRTDLQAVAATPDTSRRELLWVAIGMIREHHGYSTRQALTRARGSADKAGLTLDELAVALLDGRDLF